MQFHSRANRKLIALAMMAVFTVDTYAAIYLKPGVLLPGPGNPLPAAVINPVAVEKPATTNSAPMIIPSRAEKSEEKIKEKVNVALVPEAALLEDPGKKKPDIDGPGQPESKGFHPAGLDNMVDLFTGDFSYNVPLLDVGGYPVNLFYNGGITMDQEASWVGLGFNINPGSVTRNMRGLPDDFDGNQGDVVTKVMNIKKDLTVGVSIGKVVELFGAPKFKKFTPASNVNVGINYNNYRGVGLEAGFNPAVSISKLVLTDKTKDVKEIKLVEGNLPGGIDLNLNSQSGMTLSPYINFKKVEDETTTGLNGKLNYNSRAGLQSISMGFSETKNNQDPTQNVFMRTWMPGLSANISFAKPAVMPTVNIPMNTFNANLSLRFGKGYHKGLLKGSPTLTGYLSISQPKDKVVTRKAFGYFNYAEATGKEDLLDFNRINDIPYQQNNPVMSFPVYTYDIFSISGEGTGGSFRGYRSDIGFMRDPQQKSVSSSSALGVGLNKGDGDELKVDVDFNYVATPVETGPWKNNNLAREFLQFTKNKGTYQSVYFKNPAEKTMIDKNYFEALGGEDLVRIKMSKFWIDAQLKPQFEKFTPETKYLKGSVPIGSSTIRQVRDKRAQVITTLSAGEAEVAGLNSRIEYYPINVFPRGDCDQTKLSYKRWESDQLPKDRIRKKHHLSEVTVLGGDGRRYVYGIPVYNIRQKDVTFNVQDRVVSGGNLVPYFAEDASEDNKLGKDHYYQREEMPSYAHSFLLTGLLSPDYVDIKGDGITEDDLGNAVKFNYSKMNYGGRDFIKWRLPFSSTTNLANYSKGIVTDKTDDKAHYSYGEREQWYLNSIESKTMIATFVLDQDVRLDGYEAAGENGGNNPTVGSYRLKEINLYSKAAYKISGSATKPIKTVHFDYDYSLCPGTPQGQNGSGKLTLKRVWFSYAGNNQRTYKNAYVFKYGNNVTYDRTANDRWGNYKNAAYNPANGSEKLPNDQYPYVNQAANTDEIAPWQLNEVILPSGGKIKISYEADDYGFVQNKRAASMIKIAGFGETATGSYNNLLYTNYFPGFKDKTYVFFQAAQPLHADEATAKKQIAERYLAGLTQLYLKLYLKVPSDQLGSGYEPVGLYADIIDFGPTANRNYFWVKTASVNDNVSQIMETLVQFGKDNVPSKIYPGFNTRNEGSVAAMGKALMGMLLEILRTVGGFDLVFRKENKFKEIKLDYCYARLSHPDAKKKGGGYRVKEVRIQDQWNKMTQQYNSEFGQVYDYTTLLRIAGEDKVVSSGVASYEPAIGSEENPFREVMRSRQRIPLAKNQFLMQELPVGEMFFPSAMVGYSKVRVSSIKKTNVKNGVTQQESTFYTTKDFPTLSSYTSFDAGGKVKFRPDPFSRVMTHYSRRTDCLSQGLLVNLNDMNGKLHTQITFADNDLKNPVNYTENIYKMDKLSETQMKLNNLVPVVKSAEGKIFENELVGKDVEVMVDLREHVAKTYTTGVKDANLEILKMSPPILIPVLLGGLFYDESVYRSASVVKVINTYGILDSVINIDKGSQVSTKNMLYDGETGEVLVNRTNNEFDKPVYNFNYPAHWAYKEMGPAYKNIQAVFTGIDIREGQIVGGTIDPGVIQSGDELLVVSKSVDPKAPAKSIDCQMVEGAGADNLINSTASIIWALDTQKDPLQTVGKMLFIDRNGNLFTGKSLTLKILRSGYRNLLGASVGSTVSQFNPIKIQSGVPWLVINNLTGVLNAGVQEFKENWRVDTLLEKKDSQVRSVVSGNKVDYYPLLINTFSMSTEQKNGMDNPDWNSNIEQAFYSKVEARRIKFVLNWGTRYYRTKSWQLYDFSGLPANGFVTYAQLTLGTYRPGSAVWSHVSRPELTNRFYLTRTRHPWYAANSNLWKNTAIFNVQPGDIAEENGKILGPLPVNGDGVSNESVKFTDVTKMVRAMKRDMALGYATAFRISLSDNMGREAQRENKIRFKSHTEPNTNCLPDQTCTSLQVTCLTCPPGYSVEAYKEPKGVYTYYRCAGLTNYSYCQSIFTRLRVNPYTTGMLGNWRPYRSKVYYSGRVENQVTQPAFMNKAGVINDFKPYWVFNAAGLTTSTATEWVWNSEITQFNQKGAELENKDPLGRYNAGLYGYNELLPIAVANNARYQELAYDGFEDYGFSTQNCEEFCKKGRRLNYNNGAGITIDNTVSHSGLSSMRLNGGTTVMLDGLVKPKEQTDNYAVNIPMISNSYTQTWVQGKGIGYTANYYASNNFTGTPVTQTDPQLNMQWPKNSIIPQAAAKSIKWEGYVQAPDNGTYVFEFAYTGNITVRFSNVTRIQVTNYSGNGVWRGNFQQTLTKGSVYRMEVEYKPKTTIVHSISLIWLRLPTNIRTSIPASLVYPPGTENLAPSAIVSKTWWCYTNNGIGGRGNYLQDGFNLIQERKMWVSAWVKEGSQDCKCSTYTGPGFQVYLNGSATTTEAMRASGSIIDGWQRFEGEFTIPNNATSYSIRIMNTGGNTVWMDDIRIQPFNSQMKSFVYHPVNLRLMAEMDENNYATFYEYDDDGTLVRVKKETEKGVKTISESRTSLQKVIDEQ